MYQGTRGPLGSNFGSNANQATIGNSNYNALQVTLRHNSKRLDVLAGYTFSKSQDQSSNIGEEVNPLDPALSKALSAFDVKHNFVVSYNYQLPIAQLFRASNRWTEGWELSGITRFSSGLPVTLINFGDNSLLGAEPNGINNFGVDEPDYTRRPPQSESQSAQRAALFQHISISARTRWARRAMPSDASSTAPGMDNYDMALLKKRAGNRVEVPAVPS